MAETIDVEARKAASLVTDIDKQRRQYVTVQGDIRIQFVSPAIVNYERFYFYLLRNSVYQKLDEKYYYRPDYLSFDQYGTTTLWTLLLYVNNVGSLEDFDIPKVFIPDYASVLEVSKITQDIIDPINIDAFNETTVSPTRLQIFSSKVRLPTSNSTDNVVSAEGDSAVESYLRQKFTLNQVNILNKFVDLGYIPVPETIEVKIVGQNLVLVYDVHFTIKDNEQDEGRRLSWSDADNPLGDGLESVLAADDVLDISYTKDA